MSLQILFDVGGTKVRVALSRDGETLVGDPLVFPTPPDFETGVDRLASEGLRLAAGEPINLAAGGVPGPFDVRFGTLTAAPNLPGWVGAPLRERLREKWQSPVLVENDAALVGLGEAVYGAGRGERIVAYLTVSTGVGGARLVDGRIDERALSFEPGHQIIDSGKTLQDLISGRAVENQTGCPPREITDAEFWNKLAYWLALGLNNTIVHWSPQVVVLGGSMFRDPGIKISDVDRHLKTVLRIFNTPPPLKKATLDDFGGLYGAMALLRSNH